jgi:hypothetical protein
MDPVSMIGLGLSVLPKIPELWGKVAGLFGKEVPKSVQAAGQLAAEVQDMMKAGTVSPEVQAAMAAEFNRHEEKILEIRLEERRLDAGIETTAITATTERHKADMLSDSWLSKNVRPLTLLAVTLSITIGIYVPSVDPVKFKAITDLGVWVYGYYFVGRTVEKGPVASAVEAFKTKEARNAQ